MVQTASAVLMNSKSKSYREIWSDHWEGVGRGCRWRLPKEMVNSLGQDRLRSRMPPEHMELWARRFEIKGGFLDWWALGVSQALSCSRMPECLWCSCPCFPMDDILVRKELLAQSRIRLAWQRVAGLFFFGCSRGDELWGRGCPFFQNCVAFVSYFFLVLN